MHLLNFNGTIQSENLPVIHAWNRAFRFGDGLFESIAVTKNTIPFLDDHWSRIASGAKVLSLELSQDFSKDFLQKSIIELLSLNSISGSAYARVMLFREGRGRYEPESMRAGYLIETISLESEIFSLNEKGLSIGIYPDVLKSIDALSGYKTCSALVYVLASVHQSKEGWDDCLILNSRSNVCESTNSNLFIVKNNIIYTPSLEEGCVNGVMRRQIISIAEKNDFTVSQTALELETIHAADEIFLTNAVSGIRWVKNFGGKEYGNERVSTLSKLLRTLA